MTAVYTSTSGVQVSANRLWYVFQSQLANLGYPKTDVCCSWDSVSYPTSVIPNPMCTNLGKVCPKLSMYPNLGYPKPNVCCLWDTHYPNHRCPILVVPNSLCAVLGIVCVPISGNPIPNPMCAILGKLCVPIVVIPSPMCPILGIVCPKP